MGVRDPHVETIADVHRVGSSGSMADRLGRIGIDPPCGLWRNGLAVANADGRVAPPLHPHGAPDVRRCDVRNAALSAEGATGGRELLGFMEWTLQGGGPGPGLDGAAG